MDVKYVATTSDKLSELAIVNGQLIFLSDLTAMYYDMGSTRRSISSMRLVSSLPSTATAQEGMIYGLVNASGHVDAHVWDASASTYRQMAGYAATTTSLGLVRPDGLTITIDENGVISCHAEVTELPADHITYNNTLSGLASTTAQAAIDEVKTLTDNAATAAANAATVASSASAAASSAIAQVQTATDAAAAASTAAQTAVAEAAAASTAAQSALDLIAQSATVISAMETRLQAVEAVATDALMVESNN